MRRFLLLSLLLVSASLIAAEPSPVATLDGATVVTADQLDRAVATKLLQLRAREYDIRRAAVDELVDQKLLAKKAEKLGITIDELLRREVTAKTAEVSGEDLEGAYASAQGRVKQLPPEQGKRTLAEMMQERRTATRRAEYLNELRKEFHTSVLLDPPRVAVAAANAPAEGPIDAPITIVEFADFQCPYCGREVETLRSVRAAYGKTVRIAYRHFPLPNHPDAPKAAEAGACAAEQGKFWEYATLLYANQKQLGVDDLKRYAETAKLDAPAFAACLDSARHAATWKADRDAGEALGITGTPTLFINGRPVFGVQPLSSLTRVIDEELERAGVAKPEPKAALAAGGK